MAKRAVSAGLGLALAIGLWRLRRDQEQTNIPSLIDQEERERERLCEEANRTFDAKLQGSYLNPALVAKSSTKNGVGCHRVRCYYNLLWWACPNPYDQRRATSLERQFMEGRFIDRREYFVPDKTFCDRRSWNS